MPGTLVTRFAYDAGGQNNTRSFRWTGAGAPANFTIGYTPVAGELLLVVATCRPQNNSGAAPTLTISDDGADAWVTPTEGSQASTNHRTVAWWMEATAGMEDERFEIVATHADTESTWIIMVYSFDDTGVTAWAEITANCVGADSGGANQTTITLPASGALPASAALRYAYGTIRRNASDTEIVPNWNNGAVGNANVASGNKWTEAYAWQDDSDLADYAVLVDSNQGSGAQMYGFHLAFGDAGTPGQTIPAPTVDVRVDVVPGALAAPATIPGPTVDVRLDVLPGALLAPATISGATVDVRVDVLPGPLVGSAVTVPGPNVTTVVDVIPGPMSGVAGIPGASVSVDVAVLPGALVAPATIPGPTVQTALDVVPGALQGSPASLPGADVAVDVDVVPGPIVPSGGIPAPLVAVAVDVVPGPLVGEAQTIAAPLIAVAVDVVPGPLAGEPAVIPGPSIAVAVAVLPGGLVPSGGIAAPVVVLHVDVIPGPIFGEAQTIAGPTITVDVAVLPGPIDTEAVVIAPAVVAVAVDVVPGAVVGSPGTIPGPTVTLELEVVPGTIFSGFPAVIVLLATWAEATRLDTYAEATRLDTWPEGADP